MTGYPQQDAQPGSPLFYWLETWRAFEAALIPLQEAHPGVKAAAKEFEANLRGTTNRYQYAQHAQHNWNAMLHLPSELETAISHLKQAQERLEQDRPILSPTVLPMKPE